MKCLAKEIKCLAVMLFHNDEDLVEDQIIHMLKNNHDILIFDHNSNDNTTEIILDNQDSILDYYLLKDDLVFQNNEVFAYISKILIQDYSHKYDWITFIESDEFLEGPNRTKNYYNHLQTIDPKYTWVTFDNFVFWYTDRDDPTIESPAERIKYYAYKESCGIRVYAWRGNVTNERWFNHNPPKNGNNTNKYPTPFRTCHYELRSEEHAKKKLNDRVTKIDEIIKSNDEKGLNPNGGIPNIHYKVMHNKLGNLGISCDKLHYDYGGDLIQDSINNFDTIYNNAEMGEYQGKKNNKTSHKLSHKSVKMVKDAKLVGSRGKSSGKFSVVNRTSNKRGKNTIRRYNQVYPNLLDIAKKHQLSKKLTATRGIDNIDASSAINVNGVVVGTKINQDQIDRLRKQRKKLQDHHTQLRSTVPPPVQRPNRIIGHKVKGSIGKTTKYQYNRKRHVKVE
jgi:hypothetical protein